MDIIGDILLFLQTTIAQATGNDADVRGVDRIVGRLAESANQTGLIRGTMVVKAREEVRALLPSNIRRMGTNSKFLVKDMIVRGKSPGKSILWPPTNARVVINPYTALSEGTKLVLSLWDGSAGNIMEDYASPLGLYDSIIPGYRGFLPGIGG